MTESVGTSIRQIPDVLYILMCENKTEKQSDSEVFFSVTEIKIFHSVDELIFLRSIAR